MTPIDSRKKILVITNVFPRPSQPNTGFYVYEQVKRLSRWYDIRVLTAQPRTPFSGKSRRPGTPVEFNGVTVYETDYAALPKIGVLVSDRVFYRAVKPLVQHIRGDFTFDLILCYWTYPEGAAAGRLAADYGVPLIIRPRGSDINIFWKNPLLRTKLAKTLKAADKVIPVTRHLMETVKRAGVEAGRLDFIHNGINHDEFYRLDKKEARAALNLDAGKHLVLFAGNFLPVKGVENYLKAIERIDEVTREGLIFMFLGKGPLQAEIEKSAARLKHARIMIHGDVPHNLLVHWMNAADLLCLPSLNEGCPNVILEAMACGLPVAASDVGGVPELLTTPDAGLMFSPRDPHEMADVILQALNKKWDRKQIAENVKEVSWEACAGNLKGYVEKLLQ